MTIVTPPVTIPLSQTRHFVDARARSLSRGPWRSPHHHPDAHQLSQMHDDRIVTPMMPVTAVQIIESAFLPLKNFQNSDFIPQSPKSNRKTSTWYIGHITHQINTNYDSTLIYHEIYHYIHHHQITSTRTTPIRIPLIIYIRIQHIITT